MTVVPKVVINAIWDGIVPVKVLFSRDSHSADHEGSREHTAIQSPRVYIVDV